MQQGSSGQFVPTTQNLPFYCIDVAENDFMNITKQLANINTILGMTLVFLVKATNLMKDKPNGPPKNMLCIACIHSKGWFNARTHLQ